MATSLTKSELEEELTALETSMSKQNNNVIHLELLLTEKRKKIRTLKSVARHYKGQRDEVNAYLSAVLDLVVEKEQIEVPEDRHEYKEAMETRSMRREFITPRTSRPTLTEPDQLIDEPYSSLLGRHDKREHWEDL